VAQPKTLASSDCKESIVERISRLKPDSPRQWGKMSAHQMLCHLYDSFCAVISEREVSPARLPIPRPIVKWLILWAPRTWPHNVKTRPEIAQDADGTPPDEFERDRQRLLDVMHRFCSAPDSKRSPHPMMGSLTWEEWMRWGYLHSDHHLRQFGV